MLSSFRTLMLLRWLGPVYVAAVLHVWVCPVHGQDAAAAFPGAADYLEGIDGLQAYDLGSAADAFGRAITADDENADFFAARGAALVLADRYPEASKDLQRALRLDTRHHGATVWLGVITRVGGEEFNVAGQEYCIDHDGYEAQLYGISMAMAEPARRRIDIERAGGDWPDAPQPDAPDVRERVKAAKAQLPEVAAEYAGVLRANPRLGGMVFTVAKNQYNRGDFARAIGNLRNVENQDPDNPEMLYYMAGCELALGNADSARRFYTRVLTHWTGHAYSYLGRAVANARLGNATVSRRDVEVAHSLNTSAAEKFLATEQKVIDGALASVPPQDPVELWHVLQSAAIAGEKNKALIESATGLIRAMNARRLRYDETYQDGLRVRQAAVDSHPGDADALANLADYIYREVDVRGSGAEESAPVHNWRYQTDESKERELARAEAIADQALTVNPNHVTAMAVKAAVRMRHVQWADGETLLKRALSVDSDHPQALNLFAEVLEHVAAVRRADAWRLRQSESWEDSQYIYTRYPSEAEIAQAEELERQSRELMKWAAEHIQRAADAHKGTAEGFYWQGFLAYHYGRMTEAIGPLEQAARLEPSNVAYAELLANAYEHNGQSKEGIEERFRALNLLQTTDSTLIRLAWECIKTDRWRSAREVLDRAVQIDPADPRLPAYYALCAEGEGDMSQAAGFRRMTLAIDEARIRLQGNTFKGENVTTPLFAGHIGLTATTRNRLGAYHLQQQDWKAAGNIYDDNLAMEQRIPESEWVRGVEVFTGVPADRTTVAGIMGASRYGLAFALFKQNRLEEAADNLSRTMQYAENEQPQKDTRVFGYEVYRALVEKGGPELAAAHFNEGLLMMYQHEDHVAENQRILHEGDAKQKELEKRVLDHQKKMDANDVEMREVQQKIRRATGEEREKLQRKYEKLANKRQDLMEEFQRLMQDAQR